MMNKKNRMMKNRIHPMLPLFLWLLLSGALSVQGRPYAGKEKNKKRNRMMNKKNRMMKNRIHPMLPLFLWLLLSGALSVQGRPYAGKPAAADSLHLPGDTLAADTVVADSLPAEPLPLTADSLVLDSLPVDNLSADSLPLPADTLAADTLVTDSLAADTAAALRMRALPEAKEKKPAVRRDTLSAFLQQHLMAPHAQAQPAGRPSQDGHRVFSI